MIENVVFMGPVLAGFVMIVFSFLLLTKRIINLTRKSGLDKDVLSVEISKLLSIKTRNPTIALFVIGLLLLVIPLFYWVKTDRSIKIIEARYKSYKVEGKVEIRNVGENQELKGIDYERYVKIFKTYPPCRETKPDGSLPDDLKVARSEHGFPTLTFTSDDKSILSRTVDLNDIKDGVVVINKASRVIHLLNPVILYRESQDNN